MEVKANENDKKGEKNIKVTEVKNKDKKEITTQISSSIFGSEINYII